VLFQYRDYLKAEEGISVNVLFNNNPIGIESMRNRMRDAAAEVGLSLYTRWCIYYSFSHFGLELEPRQLQYSCYAGMTGFVLIYFNVYSILNRNRELYTVPSF